MTKVKLRIFSALFVLILLVFLSACDESPPAKSAPAVVQKTIKFPTKPKPKPKAKVSKQTAAPAAAKAKANTGAGPDPAKQAADPTVTTVEKVEHYDARGKIDPFKALIQSKPEVSASVKAQKPKRILTPLEKIDLSQIKLVAVIEMKGKTIAMVEESSGKGYEVGVGTYIGRNEGRVAEITSSSIIVRELIRDFQGRMKEREQEIKLNKLDGE